MPELFKAIVDPGLLVENMHYHVSVVHKHPGRPCLTLNMRGTNPLHGKNLHYLVSDRPHLCGIASRAYHKIIRKIRQTPEIEDQNVECFFFVCGPGNKPSGFKGINHISYF